MVKKKSKKMKKLISIISIITSCNIFSQVIIGDKIGTVSDKTSVLLEFANNGNEGLILPYVISKPSTPTEGTILLDATTPAKARVKYYNGVIDTTKSPEGWQDLSGQDADVSLALNDQPTTITEVTGSKAIIGSSSSSADGVLVLESDTKAMVLPVVATTDNIPSPSPGMIVFINKSGAKRLAVFNGSKWSYWKP